MEQLTSSIQLCSANRSFSISVEVLPGNCCCCSVTRCEQLINRLNFSWAILWKRSARAAQMRHNTMSWKQIEQWTKQIIWTTLKEVYLLVNNSRICRYGLHGVWIIGFPKKEETNRNAWLMAASAVLLGQIVLHPFRENVTLWPRLNWWDNAACPRCDGQQFPFAIVHNVVYYAHATQKVVIWKVVNKR